MTAVYILVGVAALIALLMMMRVCLIGEYDETGFSAYLRFGPVRIKFAGKKDKKADKKKKKDRKAKKKDAGKKQEAGQKKGGTFEGLKAMLPDITDVLRRLFRRLTVDDLIIHYVAAGRENPAAGALQFGAASAGIGVLLPILESVFTIKRRDLRTNVDFNATEAYVYAKAKLSLAFWQVLVGFIRLTIKSIKLRSSETNKKGGTKHG
ncbi:MAG TPA: hypothetical protein GXZ77_01450 [Papillibacter sp.]|nr:hypothetical protein [Papillibacter sp.]